MSDGRNDFYARIKVIGDKTNDIAGLVEQFARELEEDGKEVTVQNLHDKFLEKCDSLQQQEKVRKNSAAILIAIEKRVGDEGVQKSIEIFRKMVRSHLRDRRYSEETLKAMIVDHEYSTDPLGALRWQLQLGYVNIAIQQEMSDRLVQVSDRVYCDNGLAL